MRKQILTALLFVSAMLGMAGSASAQRPFRFSQNTIRASGTASDTLVMDIMVLIFNESDRNFDLRWKRVHNTFPFAWDYSLCDNGNCYIGVPDSGNTGTVQKGGNGFLKLNVIPGNITGTAEMKFFMYEDQKESEGDTVTFIVNITETTGIGEETASGKVNLTAWPNPAHDRLSVSTGSALPIQSALAVDATGRAWNCPVLGASSAGTQFSTESLPAGVYMLRFVQGSAVYSAKFIKE